MITTSLLIIFYSDTPRIYFHYFFCPRFNVEQVKQEFSALKATVKKLQSQMAKDVTHMDLITHHELKEQFGLFLEVIIDIQTDHAH